MAPMRARSPLCLALSASLALSACGSVDPGERPKESAPAGATISQASVRPLDGELLAGVDRESVTSNAPAFYGAWFRMPSTEFTDLTKAFVEGETEEWAKSEPTAIAPTRGQLTDGQPAIPELNVQPELTDAGSDLVGIRYVTDEFAGGSSANSYRTFWYDGSADSAGGSEMLIDPASAADVLDAVVSALRADQRTDPDLVDEAASASPEEALATGLLDSLNFTADGDLVVELDDYSVAAGSQGTIEITLPADEAAAWLSDFGSRAQEAAQSPTAPEFLAEQAAPSDDPTGTAAAPSPSSSGSAARPAPGDVDCTVEKCVALTFDDGPGQYTDRLLDILAEKQAKATFFVVGPNVEAFPGVVRRAVSEGHQIGAHSWTHRQMTSQTADEVRGEITRTSDAVEAATGHPTSAMRPPYGAVDGEVRSVLAGMDRMGVILWDVDTLDWKTRSAWATVDHVRTDTRNGSIILMHDIHKSTVDAVPEAIDVLQGEGYHLVTVDELLASEGPESGVSYSRLG